MSAAIQVKMIDTPSRLLAALLFAVSGLNTSIEVTGRLRRKKRTHGIPFLSEYEVHVLLVLPYSRVREVQKVYLEVVVYRWISRTAGVDRQTGVTSESGCILKARPVGCTGNALVTDIPDTKVLYVRTFYTTEERDGYVTYCVTYKMLRRVLQVHFCESTNHIELRWMGKNYWVLTMREKQGQN
jgi:hypothetical protein